MKKNTKWVVIAVIFWVIALFLWIQLIPVLITTQELNKTNYGSKQFHDPTYTEMKEFLAYDQSDLNKYRNSILDMFSFKKYVCLNFARDVKKNAIKQGIRCAGVDLHFKKSFIHHCIVAFSTTDKGVIFIDPQLDDEVKVIIGQDYQFMGIVTDIKIYFPTPKK